MCTFLRKMDKSLSTLWKHKSLSFWEGILYIVRKQNVWFILFRTRNVSNNTNAQTTLSKLTQWKFNCFPIEIPPQYPPQNKKNIKNTPIEIASAHNHIPRNNPAKFQKNPIDSLGGVVDKGPLFICLWKNWFWGQISPKILNYRFKIASADIHILRNNPAKLHSNSMDSLGGVADNRFRTDGTEEQG